VIYVELPLTDAQRDRIRRTVGDAPVWFAVPGASTRDDRAAFGQARVAFGNCPPAWLEEAAELRWLQLASVGVDGYLGLDLAADPREVVVTNLSGEFADPVAETCVAGLLALFRGVDRLVLLGQRAAWDKDALRPELRLLGTARVVVLGTGSISRRIVALLRPFGCEITLFGRSAGDLRSVEELAKALPHADVVIGLLPDTPQTADLLDARRLALLPPGAVVVNAGRGSLLDEEALVAGLRSGHLGGAVLDVTRAEPIPPGHPLWSAPNTVLTQHTAGGSVDELDRVIDVFDDNWSRFVAGTELRHVVYWNRGY
jgi:glyoxylate/hydroxypyruvate reductase